MEYMLMPLKRYADFQGRSRRKEYWMFILLQIILFIVVGIIAALLGGFSNVSAPNPTNPFSMLSGVTMGLFGILMLALIIPSIAVQVRRFHDQNRSGWFVLLGFVPYIGGLVVLIFMLLEGTKGPNRFGEDPKGQNLQDVFS
ncbi:MAG: DUF805 domain-containing protein [Alphaproteobacteria bacterium]|nr:DUF805 domain-containing protein [Alphaproteobacteria bacterium]